jgi:hypothetical protein
VRHNLLRDNDNGIIVLEDRKVTRWAADTYRQGLRHVDSVRVHDNDIGMTSGLTGMWIDNGDTAAYWRPANSSSGTTPTGSQATRSGPRAGRQAHTLRRVAGPRTPQGRQVASGRRPGIAPADATAFALGNYGAQDDIQ